MKNHRGVIAALERAARAHPTERICQIISNATGLADPFYVEDNDLIAALNKYATHEQA